MNVLTVVAEKNINSNYFNKMWLFIKYFLQFFCNFLHRTVLLRYSYFKFLRSLILRTS